MLPLQISYRSSQNPRKGKKVKYATRVLEVDQGSFTPLVFSCFGGMSRECSFFFKRMAEKLAEKRNLTVSETTYFVRVKINMSLIRSLVLCLRGSRSTRNHSASVADTDIVLANHMSDIKEQ